MHTERTIDFYDARVKPYFEEWRDNELLLPLLRALMARLPEHPRILDLGCGPGTESRRLVDLGADVVGVDLSEPSLEIATAHVPEARFLKMDALSLEFPEASYNAVLDAAVLFHFTNEEQAAILKRLAHLLQPNGTLLSIYMTGDYIGLQHREFDGKQTARFVNLKSLDRWIGDLAAAGFRRAERTDFAEGPFRAAVFSRAGESD